MCHSTIVTQKKMETSWMQLRKVLQCLNLLYFLNW